ncbi:chromosome segregation protein SMC [Mesoaciditoga lauensis]|uniref:chromosome segregation protein SMC n=1 Tax=Mesoaciditoga lauensis TaxID=1495039 RepID=UPI0005622DB6|nr:chromosome segregation protein SMC [Mesoaciditoga lauensis]
MRLVRLEIEGFKSFGTYAQFRIPKGITCIVGPNGSGKSNVVDAVRWIFGERANSKLRMSTASDVLYAGSPNVKKAERAWVKAIFLDENNKEISVERIFTADGKNSYFLNGSSVRLKDIANLFMGTGTGRDLYSIVGQGEISNLVNSSPEQIKALVEEAANVAVYKVRKAETLSKLMEVEENLQRLQDIINEVERNMRSLNLKSKRAKKYQEYESELNKRKRAYFGHFYFLNSNKLKEVEEKSKELSSDIEKSQKELFDLEIQTSELKELSSGVEEEIKRFESELEKYRQREKTLANLKELYSSKLSNDRTNFVELGTKKDSMRSEIDRSYERLEELKRLISSLDEEYEKMHKELESLESIYNEKTEEISRSEKKRTEMESEISKLTKQRNSLEVARSKASENIKDLKQRLEVLRSQLAEKNEKATELQKKLDEISQHENTVASKLENKNKKLSEIELKRQRIESSMAKLREQREKLNSEKMELSTKRDVLKRSVEEYAGYSKAVRAVMNAKIDGVIDVVANLLDVPRDIEVAISILLGGRAQNIVVKNSDVAQKCVEFLKRTRSGRATFIPMDMIDLREPVMNTSIISAPGMIGYAAKLVKSVVGYEGLVNFLFSHDLIVRTLQDAVDLKRKRSVHSRIVSLDGQLVASSGTITGGSIERSDFVSYRRMLKEIEGRILTISQELKEIDAKIADLQVSREIAFKEKNDIEKTLLQDNLALNNSRNTKESILAQLASLQREVENLEKFERDYLKRIEKDEKILEDSEIQIKEIDSEISSLEGELKGDTTDTLKRRQEIESLQEKMIDIKMNMNSLNERAQGYRKEAARLSKRVDEIETDIAEINSKIEEISKDMKQSEERLNNVEKDLSSVRKDMEELFSRSKDSKGNRDQTLQKLEQLERRVNEKKENIEKAREELHALELEKVSLGNAVQNALDEFLKAGGDTEESRPLKEEELNQIAEEIESYERKMKFLGPVDLSAIDEYSKVEARHKELLEQKVDLEKSKLSLEDIIKRTDEEARNLLRETLEVINKNFGKMISILFSQGSGYLSFVNEEDVLTSPVEINVKLVGKRTQKLYMLSGGERSLVGLALIFSLLMINPSAFYILDEVDAALDDFSTQRFVNLLVEYSKNSNFIVMTHNKIVMEKADTLYGITMVNGTSTVIPVELSEFSETNVG